MEDRSRLSLPTTGTFLSIEGGYRFKGGKKGGSSDSLNRFLSFQLDNHLSI